MSTNLPEDTGGMLTVALAGLEGQLNEVLKETRRLRARVAALEEENQRLRAMILAAGEGESGRQQLVRLYNEGYHVCPPHFARVRGNEGCLFCQSFLEKKGLLPDG
ncbi:initiation control protein YabA [Neomoorella thermoacetica]|uniref:DNA replication initiation control protein YabA n=3 Tax=Neomoorella thermoacetica TaxID=1525 RepID=A0A1D7X6L8_NEOTH|nr:initiation control protein YabA [Moorella thermoacetica]AKX92874.1 initiation-control protein YabA [Moorella thermoacetica]AKX95427.1 initiation-control protein YabA [Moorella thermoacetica]AOQ22544.1 DNA replication initiation control protein YabA [Moorella thermoacetica]APC07239.1 initiation-control protein YabA [Moorella thermoacetica]OIQ10230.1 initiation-control protein YabA [Moorella thermoacetica]